MPLTTDEMCLLAAELAEEHGAMASRYALQASVACEAEGEAERAAFWFTLSVLLDDILSARLDPERPLTLN